MTPVTIQFNKIVSNDVKDNEVLLEPSYRKKRMFWPIQCLYLGSPSNLLCRTAGVDRKEATEGMKRSWFERGLTA